MYEVVNETRAENTMITTIDPNDVQSLLVLGENDVSTHPYNQSISYIIAGNPRTCPSVLQKFAEDVRYKIRCRVAENSSSPLDTLKQLLKDPHPAVRAALSENRCAPDWLLSELVEDDDLDVLYDLAENPRMPEFALCKLAEHESPYVSERATVTLRNIHDAKQHQSMHAVGEVSKFVDGTEILQSTTRVVHRSGAALRVFSRLALR
jgi:hypothetical protein